MIAAGNSKARFTSFFASFFASRFCFVFVLLRFFAPFFCFVFCFVFLLRFFASFFCFVFLSVSRFHMETRFGAPPAIPDTIKCTPPPVHWLEFLVKSCLSKVIYIGTTSISGVFLECRVFCEVTPTRREARFENSQGLHAHLCTSGIPHFEASARW
jgi:hypothetical protein